MERCVSRRPSALPDSMDQLCCPDWSHDHWDKGDHRLIVLKLSLSVVAMTTVPTHRECLRPLPNHAPPSSAKFLTRSLKTLRKTERAEDSRWADYRWKLEENRRKKCKQGMWSCFPRTRAALLLSFIFSAASSNCQRALMERQKRQISLKSKGFKHILSRARCSSGCWSISESYASV